MISSLFASVVVFIIQAHMMWYNSIDKKSSVYITKKAFLARFWYHIFWLWSYSKISNLCILGLTFILQLGCFSMGLIMPQQSVGPYELFLGSHKSNQYSWLCWTTHSVKFHPEDMHKISVNWYCITHTINQAKGGLSIEVVINTGYTVLYLDTFIA